jgi:hypothetical protein
MSRRSAKRSPYRGLLSEPVPLELDPGEGGLLDEDEVPASWILAGMRPEIWPDIVRRTKRSLFDELQARTSALFDHFGLEARQAGAWKDLALSLVRLHEPDLYRFGQIHATLCERYRLNPEDQDFDVKLALRLAIQHVPRFQLRSAKKRRFTTEEIILFLTSYEHVVEHLRLEGTIVSDRTVAKLLLDKGEMRRLLPKGIARALDAMFDRLGNKKRGSRGRLSDRALRTYLAEMKGAAQKVRIGKGTEFQQQFILDVLPTLLHRMSEEEWADLQADFDRKKLSNCPPG